MKVCFVFIGTNKYNLFFDKYYNSIKENFLPESEKTFLVFSDMDLTVADDIKCYSIQHEGWPFITLKRFHFISKALEEIRKNDWLIFLDADMYAVKKITEVEFFCHQKPFFGVQHPMYTALNGTFETNPDSMAYVGPNAKKNTYYQGCFWGGRVPQVVEMITTLKTNVEVDMQNNIVAKWHDESHLNRFFSDNADFVHTYDSGYCYPECMKGRLNIEQKMIHIDKSMKDYPRFEGVRR